MAGPWRCLGRQAREAARRFIVSSPAAASAVAMSVISAGATTASVAFAEGEGHPESKETAQLPAACPQAHSAQR